MTTLSPAEQATQSISKIHSMIKGDTESTFKILKKKNLLKIQNEHIVPKIEYIALKDLVPLESQRYVNTGWVKKRLEKQHGLDMWAFGTLNVCRDINTGINYIWNGNGRFALATFFAAETADLDTFKVPCEVIDGSKEEAAYYFNYIQSEGRRTLSQEILFISRFYSNDADAIFESQQLNFLGLYVQKDSEMSVPNNPAPDSINISYRAFHDGMIIAKNDLSLLRQVRDMIASAWSTPTKNCVIINQDIFWGLTMFLKLYPEARVNGTNAALQGFIKAIATLTDQSKIDWKFKGLSGNRGVAPQLAYGLLKEFKRSLFWKGQFSNALTYKRLEDWAELSDADQLEADSE